MRIAPIMALIVLMSTISASVPRSVQASSSFSLAITDLEASNPSGNIIEEVTLGQQIQLSSTVQNNDNQGLSFVAIIDIRNERGVTVKIINDEGNIDAGEVMEFQMAWTPEGEGDYLIKQFFISIDSQVPLILSSGISKSLSVAKFDPIVKPETTEDEEIETTETPKENEEVALVDEGPDNYSILIYMVASDLESEGYFATADIEEMMKADIDPRTNVILETGGSANSTVDEHRFIDFTKVQRHQIVDNEVKTLVDLGELNMGDSETLRDFINSSISEYPAEKYAIILWDHGNGIRGFGLDDVFNDSLTLRELTDAFSQAKKNTGKQFEFIGFDACLMATFEIALRVSPYANYLVSSEEVEPEWGWDYQSILSSFDSSQSSNTLTDGKALGKIIADSYVEHSKANTQLYENYQADRTVTLSVIDLAKIDEVKDDVERLGDSLYKHITKLEQAQTFAKTMQYTERYGIDYGGSAGYADLYQLAENVGDSFPAQKGLADSLKSSVLEAVVYNVQGEAKPNAHGMSIFMQLDKYQTGEEHLYYLESEWLGPIESSAKKLESDTKGPTGFVDYASGALEGQTYDSDISYGIISFYKESEGSKYELTSYYYLDPSEFLDSDGSISYRLNEGVISLCSENNCAPAFVYLEDNGDKQFAYFPVRLESTDFNERVTLIYEIDSRGDFVFLGAWEGLDEGTAQRGSLPLKDGDKIYTYTYEYDENDSDYYLELESEPLEVTEEFGPDHSVYDEEFTFDMAFCDYADNCAYSAVFEFQS